MTDVCVVGLGKIGLPLACAIARAGHTVRGADISVETVSLVNDAKEPFPGEGGLAEALADVIASGTLSATTDTATAVGQSDVVIVVVPLLVDADATPEFRALDAATKAVAAGLRPGTLVSYETTLPVGTTRGRFGPALEAGSGLTLGEDLFLVHSPERVFSGRIFEDLRRYPKLVGGVDTASNDRGVAFYESFLEFDERDDLDRPNGVWSLGTAEAAELAKLAETTYRDVNIAFANELAVAAEGIGVDVHGVIAACNSQPFSHIHQPGIWVGGHCIPVYPHLLMGSVPGLRLPALSREVNEAMPTHALDRLEAELGSLNGRLIAVLGVAFRDGVKEDAVSGVYPIVERLEARGARTRVHDPLYSDDEIAARGLEPYEWGSGCDAFVIHTAHSHYRSLLEHVGDTPVYDGRAMLDGDGDGVFTIGRG